MHGNDDAWFHLSDNLGGLRDVEAMLTVDREQQNVGVRNLFELLFLQCVTEVAEVTDGNIINMNDIDSVASTLFAVFVIVVGGDAGDKSLISYSPGPRTARGALPPTPETPST